MQGGVVYLGVSAFCVGILVRSFSVVGFPTTVWMLSIAFALALVWRRSKGTRQGAYHILVLSVAVCCLALGIVRMEVATWSEVVPSFESTLGSEATYTGVVEKEPDVRDTTTHLYLRTQSGTILLITDRYREYMYGDVVEVTGVLEKPESFTTDLGRTFDYKGYLHARGVSYLILYGDITRIGKDEGNSVISALLSAKHQFMDAVERVLLEPYAGLGEGLLLGEKRALGDTLTEAFRRTGIIHIVVLSGYNIMLVVAFVMYVLGYFFGLRTRVVVGILAIVAFAVIVGLSATVVRASLMAGLFLIAQATGRTYAVMRALVVAGLCMLIINPYLLAFDTGFQLSFVATMGLILLAPRIESYCSYLPEALGLRGFVSATLATQVFVLPILLYQIGEFSLVAVLVNVLVLPMVPIAMLLTFLTGMLALVSTTLATPFAFCAFVSLRYILAIAEWFSAFPYASYVVPAFPVWGMVFGYAVLAYAVWRTYQPKQPVHFENETSSWTIVDEDAFIRSIKSKRID